MHPLENMDLEHTSHWTRRSFAHDPIDKSQVLTMTIVDRARILFSVRSGCVILYYMILWEVHSRTILSGSEKFSRFCHGHFVRGLGIAFFAPKSRKIQGPRFAEISFNLQLQHV